MLESKKIWYILNKILSKYQVTNIIFGRKKKFIMNTGPLPKGVYQDDCNVHLKCCYNNNKRVCTLCLSNNHKSKPNKISWNECTMLIFKQII